MKKNLLNLLFIILSIIFFYQYNFVLAIIFLLWAIYDIVIAEIKELSINQISNNIQIELKFNLFEILSHPIFNVLFNKLKDRKDFKFKTQKDWIEAIIASYKKEFNSDSDWKSKDGSRYIMDSVKYNIYNNNLWINDKIDFNDTLYHQIFIPYEQNEQKKESFFWHRISNGIFIRIFVVNGLVKLQVGNYDKDVSPNIYKDDGLAVYQTYTTISTYPLMYISQVLPPKYLNLSFEATDSFRDFKADILKNGMVNDWKKINQDLVKYNYLFNRAGDIIDKKSQKIIEEFYKIYKKHISDEGFKDDNTEDDYSGYTPKWLRDFDSTHSNKYMTVSITDINDVKQNKNEYMFNDYHEEIP